MIGLTFITPIIQIKSLKNERDEEVTRKRIAICSNNQHSWRIGESWQAT